MRRSGSSPDEFRGAIEPDTSQTLSADEEAAFSAEVFTNNIQVTLMAFALGITAGIGTAAILGYNGLFIGVIIGLAFEGGNGSDLLTLITSHGVLELSCIVVGGSAGPAHGMGAGRARHPAAGARPAHRGEAVDGDHPRHGARGLSWRGSPRASSAARSI